ncbi:hypothetical protein [Geothrix oryzisoli]|uniref:hypothetical protein n=1 Tax=Geothrix oryzisoli TaxID=2922721 RepID=UPI001FADB7C8|nr:hypothetical protein [Geothrix oryzisoli]
MIPLPGPVQEAWEAEWLPVRTSALVGVSVALLLVGGVALASEPGWIPLLDGVNLVFHEAGHPLFGLLGWETLTILGGTLMQLLVPLLVAGSFWLRREAPGTAFAGLWGFENLLNIARYVGDARAQVLPLVGGGEHDWADLLGRWGLLAQDASLAAGLRALGWLGMAACWGWLAWRWRHRPTPA